MYIHFNKIFYGSKARKLDEDIYSNRGPSNTTFIKQKWRGIKIHKLLKLFWNINEFNRQRKKWFFGKCSFKTLKADLVIATSFITNLQKKIFLYYIWLSRTQSFFLRSAGRKDQVFLIFIYIPFKNILGVRNVSIVFL